MAHKEKFTVQIASSAYTDIANHFYFLARVSKSAATKLQKTLIRDIRTLEDMPERNPPFERRGVSPGRYRYLLSAKRYRIVYQIVGSVVRVNGVEDCRQDIESGEPD